MSPFKNSDTGDGLTDMKDLDQHDGSDQGSGGEPRPRWSLAANFMAAIVIVALSTTVVMVVLRKPVWVELEMAVVIVGFAMFGFFSWVLYHGVTFSPDETLTVTLRRFDRKVFADAATDPTVFLDLGAGGFAEGGPLGCLAGLLLSVLVCLGAAVFVWFFSNFFFAGITILALPLFCIFRWSVFFILRHSGECRGRIGQSLKYGAGYAFVKAGTLYLIIYGAHLLNTAVKHLFAK